MQDLRVLIANEPAERVATLAPAIAALGHTVVGQEVGAEDIGSVTVAERVDVVLVGLGQGSEQAFGLIDLVVREAACPVIVVLADRDPAFVKEASKHGVFAHVTGADGGDLQSSLDIALRRFADYHDLEGAFGRRAVIERAKGILMERNGIDEAGAFAKLRDHSRSSNRKIVDIAGAVVDGQSLLPKQPVDPT